MNGEKLMQKIISALTISLFFGMCLSVFAQSEIENITVREHPYYEKGTSIYADIDTSSQQVYVVLADGIWRYSLETKKWDRLKELESYPESLNQLEFGYDSSNDRLLFWSRGVGKMYEFDLEANEIERIDQSFPHNNQFGHTSFFRNGELHASGGYGFWRYKNLITFFNSRINEWNIVSVDEHSVFPDPQIPYTGIYLEEEDVFLLYGGVLIEGNRFDDKNGTKISKNDIWKFNFSSEMWNKIDELELDEWEYAGVQKLSSANLKNINTLSKSFYSASSGNWYLPVYSESSTTGIYYVKPYNLNSEEGYDPIELPMGESVDFLVSNFHFNPKSKDVVLVGLDHLTNAEMLPVRVATIPEDSLLTAIEDVSEKNMTFIVASFFAVFGILITLLLVLKSRIGPKKNQANKVNAIDELISKNLFNEQELKLIKALQQASQFLETSELEEQLWSGIDNYDYRRKLRNETIKSINKKGESFFDTDKQLIVRKKDPEDHRRYHYGLNEDL